MNNISACKCALINFSFAHHFRSNVSAKDDDSKRAIKRSMLTTTRMAQSPLYGINRKKKMNDNDL